VAIGLYLDVYVMICAYPSEKANLTLMAFYAIMVPLVPVSSCRIV
jgi:hypothetical protein